MQKDQITGKQGKEQQDGEQDGMNRRTFILGLLATSAAYAAPLLVSLNEAQAASRYSRHTRHTRYTRHSRHSRGSHAWRQYPHDRRPNQGGFREGRRNGGQNGGWNNQNGGWRDR